MKGEFRITAERLSAMLLGIGVCLISLAGVQKVFMAW